MTTRERVSRLPDGVWDCERCGSEDSMVLRRSSLNDEFKADDVGLKCMECWHYATHGIPFTDANEFKSERESRGRRVRDYTEDENGDTVSERLAALGYLAEANQQ